MSVGLVEIVERVAHATCAELFASHGVALRRRFGPPFSPGAGGVAGVIDVRGEAVRGAVVVAASFGVAAACRAPGARPLCAGSASDWLLARGAAAGLAAELFERLRARARGFEDAWWPGPARALSGEALRVMVASRRSAPLAYDAAPGAAFVWVELATAAAPGDRTAAPRGGRYAPGGVPAARLGGAAAAGGHGAGP